MEIKNLGILTVTTETRFTNRIQEMGDRISGIEDRIEEMDTSVKDKL